LSSTKELILANQSWAISKVLHITKSKVRYRHDRYWDIWQRTPDCYEHIMHTHKCQMSKTFTGIRQCHMSRVQIRGIL